MKVNEITIPEAFALGKMSDMSSDSYQYEYGKILQRSTKLADIRENLSLYYNNSNSIYLLVKDHAVVIGNVSVSSSEVAGRDYYHIDSIYLDLPYRKGAALYWFLYALKEVADRPIVADGAIFADGVGLINAVKKHKVFKVSKLNIDTGEKSELTAPINSSRFCYLFESAKLGFGKQLFAGNLPYTWYPIFEELQ